MDVKALTVAVAKDFANRMQKKNMAAFAGSCAYFFILSMVPLLILISSALPYTAVSQADLVRAMILIILAMLMVMVFENLVRSVAMSHFPKIMFIVSLSSYFKFLVVIAVATIAFAMIYTYVPSARMTFVYQIPGALFSAVVRYLFSWIFSLYVDNSGYFSVYGSIATAVIMMVWLYFCIYIFLIGAFINRFFHPAVKVLYDDHHKKIVRKRVKKKSTQKLRKPGKYNEFG